MIDLDPLLSAWTARDWYGLAVLVVVLVMRVLTATDAWSRVPRSLQWLPPVVMGATAGLVDAWSSGEPWQLAIVQAVAAGLQIGLGAVGLHHASKRLPVSSGSGGAVAILLAVALAGASATACVSQRPASHHVESGAALAYSSAYVALELLSAQEAQQLSALADPTQAQLAAAETRVRRLELARDALAVVECSLAPERCTPPLRPVDDVRNALVAAVRLLRQAAETEGARVPPRAAEAIRTAEALVGETE